VKLKPDTLYSTIEPDSGIRVFFILRKRPVKSKEDFFRANETMELVVMDTLPERYENSKAEPKVQRLENVEWVDNIRTEEVKDKVLITKLVLRGLVPHPAR
jgi:hypothetical protein